MIGYEMRTFVMSLALILTKPALIAFIVVNADPLVSYSSVIRLRFRFFFRYLVF